MKYFLIVFAFFLSLHSFAGDTIVNLQVEKVIPGNNSDFYTDNLQNLYLISSSTNQVKKLDSNGDSVAVFNNTVRYGKIYSLDVTNPLKIFVYYKDFATVAILDRFLANRTTIDLRRLGITQVKALSQSYDGNIWIYDEGEGKIKKLNENNNVLLQSADLRLVFDDSLSPQKIIDNNGQLYLYDNRLGWLVFDYYTAFKKRLPFSSWQDVSADDNILSGRHDDQFFYALQNDLNFHSLHINLPFHDVVKTERRQNRLYTLTKDALTIYRILP